MDLVSVLLVLQKAHGHLALLAVAACLHPPIALRAARRPAWSTRVSAYAASALVVATNVLGWYIYPDYRETVKLEIYRASHFWGEMFEIKEHLAFFSLCLALAAAIAVFASSDARGVMLRQPIRVLYLLMAMLVSAAGVLGIFISSVAGFEYGVSSR